VRGAINKNLQDFVGGVSGRVGGKKSLQKPGTDEMSGDTKITVPNNPAALKQKVPWYKKAWGWVKKIAPAVGGVIAMI